ncbi:MAG TPA: IS630 family transposase [Thermodesulfovibrionales bacterium]|nr:IS630 family transposase [Thermodesulfovibrionales bacterium]
MNIAERIILTPQEEATINRWVHGKSFPLRLIQRAQIIKLASKGVFNHDIAKRLDISRPTVQLWRERFLALRLSGLEKDAPRPGRIPRIRHKKVIAIVNATLHTTPPNATHWSARSMAKAQGVSKDTVCRIWKQYNLKPHLIKKFKLSRDKEFLEKLYDIVGLYLNPPDKSIVFCVDEKSQIQALERTQPLLPLRPGIPARQTHDYIRHGTTTLFAALNVLDGTVIGDCLPRHRHQEFIRFLQIIDTKTSPNLDLHLIADNYGTHKHPRVQRWIKRHPRFHLHFTPTSSSWLNMVECWFSEITSKRIRRGSFKNVKELIMAIKQYIESHNQNPKVFVWTASVESIMRKISKCKDLLETAH